MLGYPEEIVEATRRASIDDLGPIAATARTAPASIFEPFGRAANAAASGAPDMGLGLYISRGIVAQHAGRAWAESPGEEQGTTVYVWLPGADQDG